jgi:peptide methionine sulfoxide reductase MsrA
LLTPKDIIIGVSDRGTYFNPQIFTLRPAHLPIAHSVMEMLPRMRNQERTMIVKILQTRIFEKELKVNYRSAKGIYQCQHNDKP